MAIPKTITPEFSKHARIPWGQNDPSTVVVHREWTSRAKRERCKTLKHHPLYWDAKAHGDYIAAQQIVEDLTSPDAVITLCEKLNGRKPLIVAPSLTREDPKNVIPIWFAYNLAYHLDTEVCREIFQSNKAHRTGRSGFYRLVNDPEFYGKVKPGQDYLIVDDVLTMGGTLASLRSFIESNGGHVIATTVLADSNIRARVAKRNGIEMIQSSAEVNLKPTDEALDHLRKKHGPRLEKFWKEQKGYGLECLTEREVDFLAFHDCFRTIRDAFKRSRAEDMGAGNPESAQRGSGLSQRQPATKDPACRP